MCLRMLASAVPTSRSAENSALVEDYEERSKIPHAFRLPFLRASCGGHRGAPHGQVGFGKDARNDVSPGVAYAVQVVLGDMDSSATLLCLPGSLAGHNSEPDGLVGNVGQVLARLDPVATVEGTLATGGHPGVCFLATYHWPHITGHISLAPHFRGCAEWAPRRAASRHMATLEVWTSDAEGVRR